MIVAGPSLDQAPPISIPVKFFLTASLFFIAIGLVLMFGGEKLYISRWSPMALGITHLITVGFLAQVMTGSMMQLLPVLAGAPLPAARVVGLLVHTLLLTGALLLAVGFFIGHDLLLKLGGLLLIISFTLFLVTVAIALLRTENSWQKISSLGIGWISLVPTVVMGGLLVLGLSDSITITDMSRLVNLHQAWGLLGWIGLVLMAVGFQLIPIFYVTKEFPPLLKQWGLPAIFILLVIYTLSNFLPGESYRISLLMIVSAFFLFGLIVFIALTRRKRKVIDAALLFIWTGLLCLSLTMVVWLYSGSELLLGVLLLGGVCLTVPIAIIYKVVPFLCWFHLQGLQAKQGHKAYTLPSMKHFISEVESRKHYFIHLAGLVLSVASYWLPDPLMNISGVVVTLSALYLFKNILFAYILFRKEQAILCS
jgi:hypothetical protein